jgi:hypothetical protein
LKNRRGGVECAAGRLVDFDCRELLDYERGRANAEIVIVRDQQAHGLAALQIQPEAQFADVALAVPYGIGGQVSGVVGRARPETELSRPVAVLERKAVAPGNRRG